MFTGIIEEQGIVQRIEKKKNLLQLTIHAHKVLKGTKIGDSVAVDGVCLTVTAKDHQSLSFDIMKETIIATTLKHIRPAQKVNLERALTMSRHLSGHFVTGHVDGIGIIQKKITKTNYVEYKIAVPASLRRYIVKKGSISVDGISLTVGEVGRNTFSVYLIPYTFKITSLGMKKELDSVNIETDILAKYVLK